MQERIGCPSLRQASKGSLGHGGARKGGQLPGEPSPLAQSVLHYSKL